MSKFMNRVALAVLALVFVLLVSALFEEANAEGTEFNVLSVPTKIWTCDLPTLREQLSPDVEPVALSPEELAKVDYYVAGSTEDVVSPFQTKTLTADDRTCETLVDFTKLPTGQLYLWATVTDQEGRQSKRSNYVPFFLVRDPGPPLAPTGGRFVGTTTGP